MDKRIGTYIRKARIEKSYSQEGLCKGICAVSYLSKIELGQVHASQEIIQMLFQRLDLYYETDSAYLKEVKQSIEECYHLLFHAFDISKLKEKVLNLKKNEKRLSSSPFFLDFYLLENISILMKKDIPSLQTVQEESIQNSLHSLEEYIETMDQRQYELYTLSNALLYEKEELFEKVVKLNSCAFYTDVYGSWLFIKGKYVRAVELLQRAYDNALQEGSLYLALDAKFSQGMCYTSLDETLMLESFQIAIEFAKALQKEDLVFAAYYNIATYYMEIGKMDVAYSYLIQYEHKDVLYAHKMAICLENLHKKEEALIWIHKGREYENVNDLDMLILDVVEYRLTHENYKKDNIYIDMLMHTFERLQKERAKGFAYYHLSYVLEVLEANRKYKEAYYMLKKFSQKF